MMTKQHYQKFADAMSKVDSESREEVLKIIIPVFKEDNPRFSEDIFMEWIKRQTEGKSLKGLRPSRNYNK